MRADKKINMKSNNITFFWERKHKSRREDGFFSFLLSYSVANSSSVNKSSSSQMILKTPLDI